MNKVKQCSKRHTISRMKMARHPSLLTMECCLLLIISTTMSQSSATRSLLNTSPAHPHNHHKITFLMPNVLNVSRPSSNSKSATTELSSQLPFSKPLGVLPPYGAVPLPETNPTTQTVDLPGIGLFFPTRATLQELELGTITLINEDIFESSGYFGPQVIGKVQGVYVASSDDGSSHMMAMSAHFSDSDFKDGLRFFGVHRTNVHDGLSHVAVIGGVGKFAGANGYATVKRVNNTGFSGAGEGGNKLLMLSVYLSQ